MNIYANAFTALIHWALLRISRVARADTPTCSATAGGLEDEHMTYPALSVNVPPIRNESTETFSAVCVRLRNLSTRDGIEAELDLISVEAQRRRSPSYELFVKLFSVDVDALLRELDAPSQSVALEIATTLDDGKPVEREQMQEDIRESGGCSLNGIAPWCCSCGRHAYVMFVTAPNGRWYPILTDWSSS